MKEINQRTCIGCNTKKDKKSLIRIVKNKNNEISIDLSSKMPGRGLYICNNKECLEKAIKNKRMQRSFNIEISDEIYKNINKIIDGGEAIG